ncbi:MAG TPA: AAA family ATPase [Acidimicrobiia bacterium]|jgi:pilus assembly protein CpaE
MSRFVLASDSSGFEQRVRRLLGGAVNGEVTRVGDTTGDLERLVNDLTRGTPEVVALGPGIDTDRALDLAALIDRDRPEISVIVVAEPTPDIWQRALRAGVRDIVAPDAPESELRTVFDRAAGKATRTKTNLVEDIIPTTKTGRIISVIAPKGGSGKTALAVNLAVGLAERHPGRVAIVDLDLLFGDVTNALLLTPEHTISDAASSGRLDLTTLKVFLTPRPGGDLYVLCAPDSPAEGDLIQESTVTRALQLLSQEFEYVIIDTAAGLNEVTLAALEMADDLVLICDMSVSAVRGMRKVIDALDILQLRGRRHFVINRADSKVGLTLSDVEATLSLRIDARLPSSRLVPRSMNEGVPLVEGAAKTPVARAFLDVVDRFSTGPDDSSVQGGFGRRRRSG